MKTATLVPTPAILAILGLLVAVDKVGVTDRFRALGMLLFLALPLLAFCEFAAFAYDVMKREEKVFSRAFVPRLVTHVVGSVTSVWVLVITLRFPALHLG